MTYFVMFIMFVAGLKLGSDRYWIGYKQGLDAGYVKGFKKGKGVK